MSLHTVTVSPNRKFVKGRKANTFRLDESAEQKERRLVTQKAGYEIRSERFARRRGGDKMDIESANSLADLGIDFFTTSRAEVFKLVPQVCEGRKWANLSERALTFLQENYDVEQVVDSEGRKLLHFKSGGKMNLFTQVSEATEGIPRKKVKRVYEALISVIQDALKEDRRIRLPQLGILKVSYRKARPKRRGRNPATGEKMWFKAKEASNKLKFRPAKELKDFSDELEVVDPKKKKKKK